VDLISLRLPGLEKGTTGPGGFALGRMGFRPFFLLAALFAVGAMPLWLLVLNGRVELETRGGALSWHAHEMIFGYTTAVIAGFLLTAASRWTGRDTAVGVPLYALAGIWLAGRLALLFSGSLPAVLVAVVDLAFLPALAVAVGRPIVATRNRRNYVMLVMLAGLWAGNLAMHLDVLGLTLHAGTWGTQLALNLVALMMLVIGARIIPMFTRNALRDPDIRSLPRWDRAAALGMGALTLADLSTLTPAPLILVLTTSVALCSLVSMRHWGTLKSLRSPMLWVLHVGYLWISVALALRGLQVAGAFIGVSTSVHALTAGAIGTLTLGMMTRVSLGHGGRTIEDHPWITVSFVLISVAAAVRVVLPEFGAHLMRESWLLGGAAWALAFLIYLLRFAPLLLTPRADGKAG
jgi:uncharacterized protein involved in response to NO